MKRIYTTILTIFIAVSALAQGWPANYGGVMLQGFSWDSYTDTQWTNLEKQSDELAQYFSLIWIPQSGDCNSPYNNMGYMPVYYFKQNSSFGTEAQLRSMIKTFKAKGLGTIADVVINHRNNLGVGGSWVDYPAETYKGVTYQMLPTDICANDDQGQTKTWATGKGISISSNNDTGKDWSGCRDLDHKSSNVQKCINAYLKYLLEDLGYTGFRYDMTKGYSASFTAQYNKASGTKFSVGEYLDGNTTTLKNWVDGTKDNGTIMSAAFDFPFRYTVRDAISVSNWSKLSNPSLMKTIGYSQYSVTFVENHDTQYRSATEQQDPIRKDTLAANAYLLAMPGTPCVFLPHWKAYKQEIKAMIDARKAAGITNNSRTIALRNTIATYFAGQTNGEKGNLIVVVGSKADDYVPSTQFTKVLTGYHYRYYLSNSTNTAWADKASGTYEEAFDVTLTAVSDKSGAKLVYSTDGNNPTASSKQVASGTKINISTTTTLKVGLLVNGQVTGIVTREYVIKPFVAHTATIYLKDPKWTTPVYFWCWDNDGKNYTGGNWPGEAQTQTKTINGEKWYYKTVNVSKSGQAYSIIFNQGDKKPQSNDLGPITEDTYYEITGVNGTTGTCIAVADVTSTMTGIADITVDKPATGNNAYYTLSGVRVAKPTQPGIYIHNGRKVVVK